MTRCRENHRDDLLEMKQIYFKIGFARIELVEETVSENKAQSPLASLPDNIGILFSSTPVN